MSDLYDDDGFPITDAAPASGQIIFRFSNEAGARPAVSSIEEGEIFINLADRAIVTKRGGSIITLGGGSVQIDVVPSLPPAGDREGELVEFSGSLWYSTGTAWIDLGSAGIVDGDKGDITVAGSTWSINAGAVSTVELGGDITSAGKALLDDASPADQRTTLGLGSAATQPSSAFAPAAHVGAGGTAHSTATTSTAGFMSAADKIKLDGLTPGVTDHGALSGLGDDDHPQYFNQLRADLRYGQLAAINTWTGGQYTSNSAGWVRLVTGGGWMLQHQPAGGGATRGGIWSDDDGTRLVNAPFSGEVIVRSDGSVLINGPSLVYNGNAILHAGNFSTTNTWTAQQSFTADPRIIKDNPLLQQLSPDATRGYRMLAAVTNAADDGLRFQRLVSGTWTGVFSFLPGIGLATAGEQPYYHTGNLSFGSGLTYAAGVLSVAGGGGSSSTWAQLTGPATIDAGSKSVVTVATATDITINATFAAGQEAIVSNSRGSTAEVTVRVGATRRFRPLTNDDDIILIPGETLHFCAANTTVFDIL